MGFMYHQVYEEKLSPLTNKVNRFVSKGSRNLDNALTNL